jgi:putative hydrolases of HD superfamily
MNDSLARNVADLYARILSLKLLPRTGWLQRGTPIVESVAEHSFGVATLALIVGNIEPNIDHGRLLSIALLHDAAEALLGDLPASARRLIGPEIKQQAERRAMAELFGALPHSQEYNDLWEEYAQGSSREARLVKALDQVEMLAQALAYERAGSRALDEFWEHIDQSHEEFPLVGRLIKQLVAQHAALNYDRTPVS